MAGKLVEGGIPALAMALAVFRRGQAFMDQREFGAALDRFESKPYERAAAGQRPAPGEDQAAGAVDGLELAFDRNLAPVVQMYLDAVAAADFGLQHRHFALAAFGADPGLPLLAAEPGIEQFFGRGFEDAADLKDGPQGGGVHVFFPGFCLRWISKRSKAPVQKAR